MISGFSILGIVMVMGALLLAVSALQMHGLSFRRVAKMAAVWAAIFIALMLVISLFSE